MPAKKSSINGKSRVQLKREIRDAVSSDPRDWGKSSHSTTGAIADFSVRVGGLGYRATVYPDAHRGGYVARLISEGAGVVMEPNGTSPSDALTRLARDLWAGDATDRKIAREIARHAWFKLDLG